MSHDDKASDFHELADDYGSGDWGDPIEVVLDAEFLPTSRFTITPDEAFIMFNALAEYHQTNLENT